MKLFVTIKFRDDSCKTFECVDFPGIGSNWITLYLPNFRREIFAAESVASMEQEFM